MRTAYIISGTGHAAILVWCVWSLAAKPLPAPPAMALPVDVVTVSDLTKITAGNQSAAKAEVPKPLVEQTDESKPVDDPAAKLDKKEVKAVRETAPPPEAKPTEAKPEKKQSETKPDEIAEALAKDEAKKPEPKPEPKKAEAKPTTPKKPAPPAPKFDPKQVEALLDKRTPTRVAAIGETLNNTASLGLPRAGAAEMSLSELDALRQRLANKWNPPAGAKDPQELVVQVQVKFRPDGTLAAAPVVLTRGNTAIFMAARDSAVRALYAGQPFDMLKPEHYEQWKDIEITFDPRSMLRGY